MKRIALITALLVFTGCTKSVGTLTLTSTAFTEGSAIPIKYTCDGENVSPELHIGNIPKDTKELALFVHDTDTKGAGFLHWAVWSVPATVRDIPEGKVPKGALQAINDANGKGYTGPCPPPNAVHHYVFEVFAYGDSAPNMWEGAGRKTIEGNFHAGVIAHGMLTGTYKGTPQ